VSDVIFLDLSKACYSVPYERLLLKLSRYGARGDGKLLLWFRFFLTNRKQLSSDTWIVLRMVACYIWCSSGLNTGTDYAPYLYVNDIPNIVKSTTKLFADDTKIYRQINNVEDSIALQSDLTTTIFGRIASR